MPKRRQGDAKNMNAKNMIKMPRGREGKMPRRGRHDYHYFIIITRCKFPNLVSAAVTPSLGTSFEVWTFQTAGHNTQARQDLEILTITKAKKNPPKKKKKKNQVTRSRSKSNKSKVHPRPPPQTPPPPPPPPHHHILRSDFVPPS